MNLEINGGVWLVVVWGTLRIVFVTKNIFTHILRGKNSIFDLYFKGGGTALLALRLTKELLKRRRRRGGEIGLLSNGRNNYVC